MEMDTPKRLLEIFDLAKTLGFVHSPLVFNEKNDYGPNGIKYRYTEESVERRIKRRINSIIKKEMNNPKIPKNDRLENKHVPGRGSGSKAAIYDRNQFIRSYFRYKKSTIKYSFSTDDGKDKLYSKKLFVKSKEVSSLTQQPVSGKHINYENLAFLSDQLYSFTEIVKFCFPPCFYSSKFNEWSEKFPAVYGIDFPLKKSTIETIAKFYGIESIQLDGAEEPFIFLDDLKYLAKRSIALKYRKFIYSYLRLQFEKNDAGKYAIELQDVPTLKKEQKHPGTPRETEKKYIHKMHWTNKPLRTVISGLYTPPKDASSAMKKEYQVVEELFHANKFNYGNRHDYDERAINHFFNGLQPSQKILALYEGKDLIESVEGCIASYENEEIKVNGCTIPRDKLIHLRVMTEN